MNQTELLKLAEASWVRKCKGYRIHVQQVGDGVRASALLPTEPDPALESDVAAWRIAFKLSHAAEIAPDGKPQYTDIYVVDDLGQVIDYYASGRKVVLNPL